MSEFGKSFDTAQSKYDNREPPEDQEEKECLECGEVESECECNEERSGDGEL